MTELMDLMERARDTVTIDHVFGAPIERAGVTIIPVARVRSGGGSGGANWGAGVRSEPVGVFAIKDGKVDWQPAVDVNKIIAGAYVVGIIGIIATPRIIRRAAVVVKAAR